MLQTVAQQLYLAYFGRPADTAGLANFSARLAQFLPQNATIIDLAQAYDLNAQALALVDGFSVSQESRDLYTGGTAQFVNSIYLNILNRPGEPEGLNFWVDQLENQGLDPAKAALEIIAAALRNGVRDADTVLRKTEVAQQFTAALDTFEEVRAFSGNSAAALARDMLSQVNAETDVPAFQAQVNATINQLIAAQGDVFNIDFIFQNGTEAYAAIFEQVEERLTRVINEGLPDFIHRNGTVIDDLRINVTQRSIDGFSGTLAFAGPDGFRTQAQGALPHTGTVVIDSADAQSMLDAGAFFDVMLHEVMHVLGAGTLWESRNLISVDGRYVGPAALEVYRQLRNNNNEAFVPVTSDNGHWNEFLFLDELLTPSISFSSDVIFSALSVATLEDLGYGVDYAQADPFVLPLGIQAVEPLTNSTNFV